MKQSLKRIASLLLAVVLVLGLFPTVGFAAGGKSESGADAAAEEPFYGFIPTPHAGTHAITDAYLRGEGETVNYFRPGEPVQDLPSKYDSRDYNYVTSVKNQNPYGSCWAHGALASVESYMIKHGISVGTGAAATTSLNLSETQHCFFNYSYAYDAEGMLTGDRSTSSDSCMDQGGNGEMSAYTLMRWTGAADESQSALAYSNASTVNYNGLDSQYAYGSNVSHVQNTVWIPGTNVDAVKQAIMEYGAGNISYYETGNAYTYICTIDTTSQSSSSHKWANHAITVVGWDDSIAVSKFSPNRPSKPGAWICKNSWGTGYFESGYCYISYEDTTMNEGYIYFYDAESIDNYQHNYQYDGTCNVVCYGKGWSNSIGYYEGFANNTKVANVFTVKGAETLRAISFCSWDEDLTYKVEIFKNPEAGNPSSGTLAASKTGSVAFAGYYTIPLDAPIALAAGESFSVVITQSAPVADDNGAYIHTPYDATFNNSSVVDWCRWVHADHGATSYYLEPNGAWTDCPENGDYRIKAYTDDIQYNVEAVANDPALGTLTVNGTKIIAEPIDGYYVAGYEVLSGTATAVININVINVAPSSDCVIRIIFAPKPTFSLSYMVSGTPEGELTAQLYDVVTLPASVSVDAEGWTFSGWTETRLVDETADKPVLYLPGADYMVLEDTVLYAVFTRVEGSMELVYEIVTAEPEDWAGNYVITYGSSESLEAFKAISGGRSYEQANNGSTIAYASTGMTLEDNCLHNAADAYLWQIAAEGSGFTIRSLGNNTYLGCSGTYLTSIASYSANTCTWTLAYDIYNGATRATNTEGGSNTQYPYFSHSTKGSYFVMNSDGGYAQCPPQFWRETTLSTTYYCTDPVVGEHEHELVHYDPAEPTCVLSGNIEYWRCSICGRCFADAEGETVIPASSVEIPALGHAAGTPEKENEAAPTCTEAGGYDMVTRCTRCGEVLNTEHHEIPALGHEFGDWALTAEPTCTEAGVETRTCSRCGEAETRPVDALGHDFGNWTLTVEPTCTEAGVETRTCSRCGEAETRIVDALGHDFGDWSLTAEPTCTETGVETRTCSRCGEAETRTVDALGHDFAAAVTKPTCTEQGFTTHTCTRCGESYTDEAVPALGHDFGDWTVIVEPSCTDDCVQIRTCSRCGETETDTLPAFGHDWEAPVYTWAEDFSSASASRVCRRDPAHTETETVIPTSRIIKEATAEEEGEIEYTAVFENDAFETQTVTAALPKLAQVNPFEDVIEGKYYYEAVLWAYYHDPQITNGTSPTTFSPEKTCTRAQVVTFLWRAQGCPEPASDANPFTDVKSKAYYYKAVLWAVEAGITSGVTETTFGPEKNCTRAQIVTFLWRASGSPEPETTDCPFTDVKPTASYYKAVLWAVENNITSGTSATTFTPGKTCTRGQVATFLYRYKEG